jgi:C1A family cysteine protease
MNLKYISYIFICLGLLTVAYADPSLAPFNSDFLNYQRTTQNGTAKKQAIKNHALGVVPSPIDLSHMKGHNIVEQIKALKSLAEPVQGQSTYPAVYDLRTLGKLTPVKNQGNYNTCWAFATYDSLESVLLPAQTWNFSDKNVVNLCGYDCGESGGGNYWMSTAYLTRWLGPVNESDDPYPGALWTTSPQGLPVQKHVQEVLFVPDRSSATDNDNIKEMVTDYGAVMTSMYMDEVVADGYLNANTTSYYFNGNGTTSNHDVAIVGWDDNYANTNFTATPPANGAFIVKNSWGSAWGDNGYFYVSYFDSNIGKDMAVFDVAASTVNYYKIYQYDPLGATANLGYGSDTAWFANVFTAGLNEELKAVGLYTETVNSSYVINVYSGFNGSSFQGLLGTTKGTVSIAGYHSIQLNPLISLPANHTFCIVVELTTPGYTSPISVESPVQNYSSQATASAGQSYISKNGTTWADITVQYPNTNVCVKAYTVVATGTSPSSSTGTNPEQSLLMNLDSAKIFPNPFNPRNGQCTINNLTSDADIKIYTITGELVRHLVYSSSSGHATWDGRNDNGTGVASGVYIVLISNNSGKKVLKIAVQR